MIVVCDMGPLHYLVLMGADHVLPQLFTRVLTPPVVLAEMSRTEAPEPVRRWAAAPPRWLEVKEPAHIEDIPALGRKGMRGDGDRAVISLAREEGADFVVMDDMKARREARKRAGPAHGFRKSLVIRDLRFNGHLATNRKCFASTDLQNVCAGPGL
jgi:predicted nucleic acid-binding protein